MNVSAIKARLGRWIETINQADNFTFDGGNMFEDAHKLATGKVAYLATPKGLHPFHGQVFKEQMIVLVGQSVGKLEEPVPALVDHRLIDAGDNHLGFLPAVRKLHFASKVLLCDLQFGHCLTIVQRAFNLFAIRCDQEGLQPKVKARAVTRHGLIVLGYIFLYHKVQIEIAKTVTLNGDGLNVYWNLSRLAELVDLALNADLVAAQQLPTGLLERETAIFLHLLKAGWSGLNLVLEIAKEQAIGFVDTINDVLNGLTTNQTPMLIAIKLFQFRDVLHQDELVQALSGQGVVFAMQRYAVVVNQPSNVYLLVQKPILFLTVELEFVGLDDFHLEFSVVLVLPNGR
jgi:hypothetical protein